MLIVTPKDFSSTPYNVPDTSVTDSFGNVTPNDDFQNFINTLIEDMLTKLFGVPFYELYVVAIDALPNTWDETKADYIIDDQVLYDNHVYKCLINTPPAGEVPKDNANWELVPDTIWLKLLFGSNYNYITKVYRWKGLSAMLVPYIYSQWLGNTQDKHTKDAGIVTMKVENATIIPIAVRCANAYSAFTELAGGWCEQRNTLYGFLQDVFADYVTTGYDTFYDYIVDYWENPDVTNEFDI